MEQRDSLFVRFCSRMVRVIDKLCDHPDHLQRLGIVGAGMAMYPLMVALILIVWLGFPMGFSGEQLKVISYALYGSMVLWGMVVIALIGIVRNFKATLPGGASLELEVESHRLDDNVEEPHYHPDETRADVGVSEVMGYQDMNRNVYADTSMDGGNNGGVSDVEPTAPKPGTR